MARVIKQETVKFIDEIPPKGQNGVWVRRLRPLIPNPGRPAQVFVANSTKAAENAVDNLNRRKMIIPHPEHHWVFMSRDNVVYAIYKGVGGRLKGDGSVRRAKPRR